MGDLAETLVISRGGLTKLVDRLVKAGLLERAFCATDRRVSYAVLTSTGREVVAEMQPIVIAELRTAFTTSLSARQAAALRDSLVTAAAGVAVQRGVPCVVLAGQVSVGRREAAAVGVDAAYGLADVSRDALVALAERVARRWGR